MADTGRLDELQRKFDENPRRFFAPLANEYRKAGNIERSIELCQEYLPQNPGHMSGYIVYGQALFDGGRHAEAVEAFQQALAADPENIIALKHLGDIARYAGDRDAAVTWYRRVIELDPKNEDIVVYLAERSPDEARSLPPIPPSASRAPSISPPLQTVYPEPAADPNPVALSELVEQPDIPLTGTPVFSVTETSVEQFAETGGQEVDVEEAKAAFAQMLSDRSVEEETEARAMFEPLSTLPLITDFTISVDTPHASPEQPVLDRSPAEPPVAESPPLESHPPEQTPEQTAPSGSRLDVPFVTETMADLYLQQGFTAQALDVYRRLAATGDDPQLLEKVQRLELSMREQEAAMTPAPSPPAVPRVTVRDFFARIGARRSGGAAEASQTSVRGLDALFDPDRVEDADARAASVLAGAYTAAR